MADPPPPASTDENTGSRSFGPDAGEAIGKILTPGIKRGISLGKWVAQKGVAYFGIAHFVILLSVMFLFLLIWFVGSLWSGSSNLTLIITMLLLLLFWALSLHEHKEGTWLFIAAFVLHVAGILIGPFSSVTANPFMIFLFLFLYVMLAGYGTAVLPGSPVKGPLICSAMTFLIPVFMNLGRVFVGGDGEVWKVLSIVYVFAPAWITYLTFVHGKNVIGKALTVFGWLYYLFFVFLMLGSSGGAIGATMAELVGSSAELAPDLLGFQPKVAVDAFDKVVREGLNEIALGARTAKKEIQGRLAINDTLYTGQVDRNAKEKLGVYFESFKRDQEDYIENEAVGIFGTLYAKTLDRPLKVTVGCYADSSAKGDGIAAAKVHPSEPLEVDQEEAASVDCVFDGSSLGAGLSYIFVTADFNFKTQSYLKRYYMNQDALRALRRNNIDPFKQYGITDVNPRTIHTAGPVMIGMEVSSPLTGINSQEVFETGLGVTIANKWQGSLRNITEFIIYLPEGLEIDRANDLDLAVEQITCADLKDGLEFQSCDDEQSEIYRVTVPPSQAIRSYKTFRFFLRSNDPTLLLGPTPLSTRFFRASVSYDYALEEKISVRIKPLPETQGAVKSAADVTLAPGTRVDITDITQTSAKVSFKTQSPIRARVVYFSRSQPMNKKIKGSTNLTTEHTALLEGLSPSTSYYVRTEVATSKGFAPFGDQYEFTTSAGGTP